MSIPDDIQKQLAGENERIRDGIVSVSFAWAALENQAALLLDGVLGHRDDNIGLAIYFAPANTETRFDVLDKAVCAQFLDWSRTPEILTEWAHIKKNLDRSRVKRNRVMHGTIVLVAHGADRQGNPKNHMRLTAPIFDASRLNTKPGQLPGLSGNDIEGIATKMWHLTEALKIFEKLTKLHPEGEGKPLHGILQKLADHRQKNGGHQ